LGKIRNRAAARRKKEGGVGALEKFLCSATTGEPRVLVGRADGKYQPQSSALVLLSLLLSWLMMNDALHHIYNRKRMTPLWA